MCVRHEHIGENQSESFGAVDLHKIIPVLQYLVSLLVGKLLGLFLILQSLGIFLIHLRYFFIAPQCARAPSCMPNIGRFCHSHKREICCLVA